jgi:predicted esterase
MKMKIEKGTEDPICKTSQFWPHSVKKWEKNGQNTDYSEFGMDHRLDAPVTEPARNWIQTVFIKYKWSIFLGVETGRLKEGEQKKQK